MSHIQKPCLQHIPADIVAVQDYQRYAREFIRADIHAYIEGGAADEITLGKNESALRNIPLHNRLFSDFSQANTHTTLFGNTYHSPILLAPVAHQALLHPDAELATACAAKAMDVPMIVSTLSSKPMQAIGEQAGQWWFQLYWQPHPDATRELIERAIAAGASAIVLTLDAPVSGVRNRAQRAGFRFPETVYEINLQGLPQLNVPELTEHDSVIFHDYMVRRPGLEQLKWLREFTDLPLLVKGVSHAQDARLIKELGYNGIIVSNHGGRTLDTLPASIDLLPAIRQAVGSEFTLLLDSGIRRGSDIIKAIARGADAVCIGRPQLWALAVAGPLGVAHMLRILQQELEMTMALCGTPDIAAIKQMSID